MLCNDLQQPCFLHFIHLFPIFFTLYAITTISANSDKRFCQLKAGIKGAGHPIPDKTLQQNIEELLEDGISIDIEQAKKIYEIAKDKILDKEKIAKILTTKKQEPKTRRVRLNEDILSRFFPDNQNQDDIQDTITKALELYYSQLSKKAP